MCRGPSALVADHTHEEIPAKRPHGRGPVPFCPSQVSVLLIYLPVLVSGRATPTEQYYHKRVCASLSASGVSCGLRQPSFRKDTRGTNTVRDRSLRPPLRRSLGTLVRTRETPRRATPAPAHATRCEKASKARRVLSCDEPHKRSLSSLDASISYSRPHTNLVHQRDQPAPIADEVRDNLEHTPCDGDTADDLAPDLVYAERVCTHHDH